MPLRRKKGGCDRLKKSGFLRYALLSERGHKTDQLTGCRAEKGRRSWKEAGNSYKRILEVTYPPRGLNQVSGTPEGKDEQSYFQSQKAALLDSRANKDTDTPLSPRFSLEPDWAVRLVRTNLSATPTSLAPYIKRSSPSRSSSCSDGSRGLSLFRKLIWGKDVT